MIYLVYLCTTIYVLVCLVMILVVLLQQGRGGDIASAFGGSSSQTAFGARSGATVLSKATTVCAVRFFMVGALTLSVLGQRGPGSVVSGVGGPAAPSPSASPSTPGTPGSATTPAAAPTPGASPDAATTTPEAPAASPNAASPAPTAPSPTGAPSPLPTKP